MKRRGMGKAKITNIIVKTKAAVRSITKMIKCIALIHTLVAVSSRIRRDACTRKQIRKTTSI